MEEDNIFVVGWGEADWSWNPLLLESNQTSLQKTVYGCLLIVA
jgi:hypothetical protein